MPLTDTALRNVKPGAKPFKLYHERGLFLIVTPAGGKWWRFKYRFDGKHKTLSLGVYPDVSLKKASKACAALRELIADSIDPGVHRKVLEAARTERAANK